MEKKKILRITTVPGSLLILLKGQLKYMNNHYNIIGVSGKGKLMDQVAIEEGIKTYSVPMTRTISPFKDLVALVRLYKLIRKEKPFIVHTHTPKAGTLGTFAARLAGVRCRLHTVAGLPLIEATGSKRLLLNLVEKFTYANSTLVLPNSFGLLNFIKENRFTKDNKLRVIGNGSSNGIDTDFYDKSLIPGATRKELMSNLKISNDDFVFVFAGRLVTDKGINELIAAFQWLTHSYENIKLVLLGKAEHDLDPLLPKTVEAINNNPNIITTGWVADVRPYFAISNCLVFPSYREGFPNVVLQACAMELPCIVTNINGCNEIVKHQKNGLVISPKSEVDLKDNMKYILDNPDKTKLYAEATRPIILKKFKREVIWEALLKLYKSLEL